jgi:pilus assembly protein CpaB
MGKWRAIIALIVALGVAVLSSLFIYRWLEQKTIPRPQKVMVPVEESVPVAAAVTDLSWGTKLTREMIREVPFYKKGLPAGYFSDMDALVGRVIIVPLNQNDAITESKLAPSSVTAGGVSALVPPGKRALAVKGDKVVGLSGFIRPGDRVDILVSIMNSRSKNQQEITKIVLQDILVLATGTQMNHGTEKGKGGEVSPVDVYTLEMTPEEGEKLILAANQGRLQFALRNATDGETVLTTGATIPNTLASFRPIAKKKPPSKSAKKKGKEVDPWSLTVQIIKGDRVNKIKFNAADEF